MKQETKCFFGFHKWDKWQLCDGVKTNKITGKQVCATVQFRACQCCGVTEIRGCR